ncbi:MULTISPECIES: hypothetical protein [unclassified Ruegeria]|uniref:amidohydrolase family protein n=1 Tax=unclassified Ruegeria TaxID=2625375 RepID=UPI00148763DA|nr:MULTISPECIES: hypothetical protein [unclassified Ruegeria]
MNFPFELRFKRALSRSAASVIFAGLLSAPTFAQEVSFPILFTNVHVFDGVNAERIENANVVVVDNLIAEVSSEPLAVANAKIIDGGGRTLIPGLIDAHVHMAITEPVADLRDNFDWMYWGAVSTSEAEKCCCVASQLSGMPEALQLDCKKQLIEERPSDQEYTRLDL